MWSTGPEMQIWTTMATQMEKFINIERAIYMI